MVHHNLDSKPSVTQFPVLIRNPASKEKDAGLIRPPVHIVGNYNHQGHQGTSLDSCVHSNCTCIRSIKRSTLRFVVQLYLSSLKTQAQVAFRITKAQCISSQFNNTKLLSGSGVMAHAQIHVSIIIIAFRTITVMLGFICTRSNHPHLTQRIKI